MIVYYGIMVVVCCLLCAVCDEMFVVCCLMVGGNCELLSIRRVSAVVCYVLFVFG